MNLPSAPPAGPTRPASTAQTEQLRVEAHAKRQAWHVSPVWICPTTSRHEIALTYIYGIGDPRALRILTKADIDPFRKLATLSEEEVNRIRQVIEQEGQIEGDLRKDVSMNIKRLIDIQSYRGLRHRRNLPVRGQRSHTNARTRKGPRKGTVAGKKKVTK